MLKIPFPTLMRTRLILACVLLQCALLGVSLFSANRIWNETLAQATETRVAELSRLFNMVFAVPLAAGDLARAADLLDAVREPEGIPYLVLLDPQGNIVAARGWDISRPLPQLTRLKDTSDLPPQIDAATPLLLRGERLGELRFGVSNDVWQDGVARLVLQGSAMWLCVLLFSVFLIILSGAGFLRYLYRLVGMVESALDGREEELEVPASGDEVIQFSRRFNETARAIKARVDSFAQSEERFHIIADYTCSVELWLNPEGRLIWINSAIEHLTGYAVNECMLLPDFPLTLASPEERGRLEDALDHALRNHTASQDFEFRGQKRDGKLFWVAMAWQPLFGSRGQYLGLRASIRDNSEFKEDRLALHKAVAELRQIHALGQSYLSRAEAERARLMALLSAMRFGVLFVDNENRVVFHNPAFCEMWGIQKSQSLIGRAIGMVLQQADNRPMISDVLTGYLEDRTFIDARIDHGELTMNDGRIITQHCYRVLDQQGVANGRMWIYEDVTQQRQLADHMINLAERDALTGLYNRHRFQIELERMVSDADRRVCSMALLFFDLDEFKHVNDTLGHAVGDQLLQVIARSVGGQVRRHEVLARLGGDEFAVLVPDCNEYEVSRLAERIVMTVSQIQFSSSGHTLRPSTSVGIAMFPQHATNAGELVAHADSAMYQAKSAGKSTWRMYRRDADQSRSIIARLSWKDRILQALEEDGFELHFQGIYRAKDRSLAHLEALVRMKDAQSPGDVIMPGQFIPHAETTGKIVEIDRWVLHKVVDLLASRPDIPSIAINISGRSFDEPGFPDYISRLLLSHQVEPRRLLVELTETAAVSDMRDAQVFIDALRATGCTVCLDDFGNGFASFAYLKQLKADVLKIDGLFIRDLPVDRDSEIFVRGMVAMARDMGKITIAEFVENEEIYNMLLEIGIDQVQGYFLDRPSRDHPSLVAHPAFNDRADS